MGESVKGTGKMDAAPEIDGMISALRGAKRIAAMTGAGVSTLCGIPDFRGPEGLYRNHDAERIFDIDWFDRDPSIYYRGCRELVYGLGGYEPGPVHRALRMMEDAGRLGGIATQNIDMLHQRAGSSRVWEVHGSPSLHRCRRCGGARSFGEIMEMVAANGGTAALGDAYVPRCPCGGVYKPDITFFGESLPEEAFAQAQSLAARADVMLVLGTSLTVHPAAGLPRLTLRNGGKVVIVNAQPTPLDEFASARLDDLASFADAVERWLRDGGM